MQQFLVISLLVLLSSSIYAQMCTPNLTPEQAFLHLTNQSEKVSTKTDLSLSKLININTASEAELVQLHGISSKKAQDIILYRSMIAPFEMVDDLDKVKGIGKATIDKNRHLITVR